MKDDLRILRDSILNSTWLGAAGSLTETAIIVGFIGWCCWEAGVEAVEFLKWWVTRL
jgi:hypothetical protein